MYKAFMCNYYWDLAGRINRTNIHRIQAFNEGIVVQNLGTHSTISLDIRIFEHYH